MAERDGLILSVDKPSGWTSFDVVNKLRGILKWKSVGHAGTLDPAATGLLIVLCGNATKRQTEFMELAKEYRATVHFGITTTTDDLDGVVLTESVVENWGESLLRSTLDKFSGEILQIPPQVSAIKVDGKRSYKRARRGEQVELAARKVTVYDIKLTALRPPEIDLTIRCSAGTYIRSIARDLGAQLGWGGTLAALERSAIGPYRVENAFSLEEIIHRANEFRYTA